MDCPVCSQTKPPLRKIAAPAITALLRRFLRQQYIKKLVELINAVFPVEFFHGFGQQLFVISHFVIVAEKLPELDFQLVFVIIKKFFVKLR
ncbi:hypothetical protein L0244_25850, partial [bacterium]|nr:hypothetical protein [bacterium]